MQNNERHPILMNHINHTAPKNLQSFEKSVLRSSTISQINVVFANFMEKYQTTLKAKEVVENCLSYDYNQIKKMQKLIDDKKKIFYSTEQNTIMSIKHVSDVFFALKQEANDLQSSLSILTSPKSKKLSNGECYHQKYEYIGRVNIFFSNLNQTINGNTFSSAKRVYSYTYKLRKNYKDFKKFCETLINSNSYISNSIKNTIFSYKIQINELEIQNKIMNNTINPGTKNQQDIFLYNDSKYKLTLIKEDLFEIERSRNIFLKASMIKQQNMLKKLQYNTKSISFAMNQFSSIQAELLRESFSLFRNITQVSNKAKIPDPLYSKFIRQNYLISNNQQNETMINSIPHII